jgi:hypothetical protein
VFVCDKCPSSYKIAKITAVPISNITCNNGLRFQEFNIAIGFVVLSVKEFICRLVVRVAF